MSLIVKQSPASDQDAINGSQFSIIWNVSATPRTKKKTNKKATIDEGKVLAALKWLIKNDHLWADIDHEEMRVEVEIMHRKQWI